MPLARGLLVFSLREIIRLIEVVVIIEFKASVEEINAVMDVARFCRSCDIYLKNVPKGASNKHSVGEIIIN